jgi:hypothetical protein
MYRAWGRLRNPHQQIRQFYRHATSFTDICAVRRVDVHRMDEARVGITDMGFHTNVLVIAFLSLRHFWGTLAVSIFSRLSLRSSFKNLYSGFS